jgi:membrane protein YqaA with SNARE-associated domain
LHWRILAAAAAEDPGAYERLKLWVEGLAAGPAGVWALFLIAFAESSFFPVPPDVLLMALCFTAAPDNLPLALWFAAVTSVGSTLGGGFGYWLGLKAGRPILKRLARQETVDSAERLLQKYDVWAVAAAGFTPIPYKVFTISSGLLRVKFVRFIVASVASRSARFFLVAVLCSVLGRWLGPSVEDVLKKHFAWATLAFFVLLFGGFYVVGRVAKRRGGGAEAEDADGAGGGGAGDV